MLRHSSTACCLHAKPEAMGRSAAEPTRASDDAAVSVAVLDWYDRHGRHDLPWQHPRTPYRVWLSEVMLQQTQVASVIPYFLRFTEALPEMADLAAAPSDQVLALWSGLGYYSRARNLHLCARICMERHDGRLPDSLPELCALPGIGRSTAGAVLALGFGQPAAILDGNVRRWLVRFHGIRTDPWSTATQKQLWELSETLVPAARVADYTQAIMDLGALVCTRSSPRCVECPVAAGCVAFARGLVGSLPVPRRRAARTVRSIFALLLRNAEGRILLQRRPPTGVWGGLWSLPEFEDLEALRRSAWYEHRGAATPSAIGAAPPQPGKAVPATRRAAVTLNERTPAHRGHIQLPEVLHRFTHFDLKLHPVLVDVDPRSGGVRDGEGERWCSCEDLHKLGLPTPVRRLLESLMEHRDDT